MISNAVGGSNIGASSGASGSFSPPKFRRATQFQNFSSASLYGNFGIKNASFVGGVATTSA